MLITPDLLETLEGWTVVLSLCDEDFPLPVAFFRTVDLADEYVRRSLPGNYKVESLDVLNVDEPFPFEVSMFVEDVRDTAEQYSVELILSNERSVSSSTDDVPVNGYFETDEEDEDPVLAVACGQPLLNWLAVLVHESCHMDQWIENIPEWTANDINGMEPMAFVNMWIDGVIELSDEHLDNYLRAGREVELDCEIRAVEKIKTYELPFDVTEYTQKANSYVFFYTMMKHTRKWYEIGKEPYNVEEVWKAMPTTFLPKHEYETVPDELAKLYLEHIF